MNDRRMPSGVHSLVWDGRNSGGLAAPSGTYLVRLVANSEDGTRAQALGTVVLRR